MEIYGLPTCDTCRKALTALPAARLVDVRRDGVPEDNIESALDRFGDQLINRRSTTWRDLPDTERSRAPRDLLAAYPSVMKRPLIVTDGEMHLGWGPEVQASLLG